MAGMASASHKDSASASNYPRTLSFIIISFGLLAIFITLASWILLSHPVGTVVQSYFYGVDRTSDIELPGSLEGARDSQVGDEGKSDASMPDLPKSEGTTELGQKVVPDEGKSDASLPDLPKSEGATELGHKEVHDEGKSDASMPDLPKSKGTTELGQKQVQDEGKPDVRVSDLPKSEGKTERGQNQNPESSQKQDRLVPSSNETMPGEQATEKSIQMEDKFSINNESVDAASAGLPRPETSLGDTDSKEPVDSDCDLYHGEWFYDTAGPLYTNNSCPVITQMQNCQGNGRPDKEYESWRWKPAQCELPRFNATKFLELMSGKTLAFVGDSVARNQMESLLCLLWQVEVPKNRGNRHMQRWHFRSKSVMICRIWSSWLVHQSSEPFGEVPQGVAKLHLDVPDEVFMQFIPNFDVVILSSGHWFAKQSVYLLNNEIVGTQLWSPPKQQQLLKINNVEAFGISVETSLTAMATHPNFTGLTILRAYSPDHYEGGAWNTGGSCTGKVRPILPGQLVENGFTKTMHGKQVTGFEQAIKKQTNRSKLKLMDITEPFSFRHDGHPGPYRSPDPNKITKRRADGTPPPQDCLHWCMPGPVDTWNELVLEIIRREFEGKQNAAV